MAKILNYNEHYFDIIDTPNKAYFLGLSLADATISKYYYEKQDKYLYRYKLNLNVVDKEIVEIFAGEIGAEVKIVETRSRTRNKTYLTADVDIKNKHLVETLANNFGGYKKDERITYNVPDKYLNYFIRGYFDGDGSISKSVSGWELSLSGREPILEKILIDLDLQAKIYNDRSVKAIRLRRKNDIKSFLNFIYKDVYKCTNLTPCITRKLEISNKFMEECS